MSELNNSIDDVKCNLEKLANEELSFGSVMTSYKNVPGSHVSGV